MRKSLHSKKAQLTVFVIIGVLVMVAIGIYVALKVDIPSGLIGPPSDIKEIVKYTDVCIADTASNGAFILAMQGGRIYLTDETMFNKAYVDNGFTVPMWHFKSSSKKPSVTDMELELEKYVNENIMSCLNFYVPFVNEYDIKASQFPKSNARISKNKITVTLDYPLDINRRGSTEHIAWDSFGSEINSNLGEMYQLASELMDYENSKAFLEDYTDEMIASSDYLPYEGMEITCSPRFWLVSQMKTYTQTLIMHNLHFFQFVNTAYDETGMPYYDKLYKIKFTDNDYKKYRINVIYNPSWGMEYEVLPSSNGVVKPYEFQLTEYVKTCVKIIHTKYNLNYPVLIQIFDESNPDNAFYFATPVMVRQNLPNRFNEVVPWRLEIDEFNSKKYCAYQQDVTDFSVDYDGNMITSPKTIQNRKNELRVYAVDAIYGYPDGVISGVNLSYQCARLKCDMGSTGYDETYNGLIMYDALPKLRSLFPDCFNGLIIANKPGYHQAVQYQTVDTETNGEQVMINMYQLKKYNYGFRIVENHNGVVSDRVPEKDEIIMLTIKNKAQDFESTIVYPSDSDYYNNLTLLLGDFTYELEIMLLKNDEMQGGAKLNWTPNLNDMFYTNYVNFYVLKKDAKYSYTTPEEIYELYTASLAESVDYVPRFE